MNTTDVIHRAKSVSEFCMDLAKQRGNFVRVKRLARLGRDLPYDDFCYAEALLKWEFNGQPKGAKFVTIDFWLLEFRAELELKFGLSILSVEEAKAEQATAEVVTGIPEASTKYSLDQVSRELWQQWKEENRD